MWRTRRERDRRRDREESTPMEGQPRVRYEWRGGKRGVGVRSSRAVAAGKRPGKQRANTSGADLRAFEPLGYTAAAAPLFYTVALRVLRSCRRTVVAVDEPPLRSSALDAPPPLATRPAVLRARGLAGYPLAPSRGRGCDRLGGLIARRAKRGALPRVFTGASRSGGVRCVSPSPPPPPRRRVLFAVPLTPRGDRILARSQADEAETYRHRCPGYGRASPPRSLGGETVLARGRGISRARDRPKVIWGVVGSCRT